MKDRTIQTVIANVALVVMISVSALNQPDTPVLGAGLTALLAINGYEVVARQHGNDIK